MVCNVEYVQNLQVQRLKFVTFLKQLQYCDQLHKELFPLSVTSNMSKTNKFNVEHWLRTC